MSEDKTGSRLNDAYSSAWDAMNRPREWDIVPKKHSGTPAQQTFHPVDRPAHYNNGKLECIDGIEAMLTKEEFIGYLRGNSLKYRWRYPYKNGAEDLKKADWYESRLLALIEAQQGGKR